MKKKITGIVIALVCLLSACVLTACGGDEAQTSDVFIGRFLSSGTLDRTLSSKINAGGGTLYTSDVYPLNTVDGQTVALNYTQSLRLKREGTYEYTYEILMRKVEQTGNTDLVKIEVVTLGEFDYAPIDGSDINFSVTLAHPASGTKKYYGASIMEPNNIFAWRLSSTPNYVLDIALAQSDSLIANDRYIQGRTVTVERGEQRVLHDNVVFDDFLTDIAPYCTYAGSMPATQPDEPDEPDEPEAVTQSALLPVDTAGGIGMALEVGDRLYMHYYTAADSITVDGVQYNNSTEKNGLRDYAVGISAQSVGDGSFVVANGIARTKSVAEYLEDIVRANSLTDGSKASLERLSQRVLAASVLNYAAVAGAAVVPSADAAALVYDSLGYNIYHSRFDLRDALSQSESAAAGFSWNGVPLLSSAGGAALSYSFNVPADTYLNLRAVAAMGGVEQNLAVTQTAKTEETETYTFTTGVYAPLQFTENITVSVFDGVNRVSNLAGYSVNRAVAKADLAEDEATKRRSRALYSLAKASAWQTAGDNVTYEVQPVAVNGAGVCAFSVAEYSYRYGFSGQSVTIDGSSAALYVGGTVTDATNPNVRGSNFSVVKDGNGFAVTLYGGSIDGIAPANGQAISSLTVTVLADTVVESIMTPMFGVSCDSAGITLGGNLRITGNAGSKLTVLGTLSCANLSVDKVQTNVRSAAAAAGVKCGLLSVTDGGALNVAYVGSATTEQNGITASGNVVLIGGALASQGYRIGLYLTGGAAQTLTVGAGAELTVSAQDTGITGTAPMSNGQAVNRKFVFDGGVSRIAADNGIAYADITVGEGELYAEADNGYTVVDDSTRPVTFTTTSGEVGKGKVTLINTTFNPFMDNKFTVRVRQMLLNGGTVHIYGMCRSGVLGTYLGAEISVANCDLTLENGHDLAKEFGRGIFAENGNERIVVENSGKLIFKNCDAAIHCWNKAEQAAFAALINNGLIILDTYKCSLESWELGAWSSQLVVENNGQVRVTNKL